MAIADYLRKLVELKNQLVANLRSMGVTADENEKLNTLVPKVLECKTEQNVEFSTDGKIISIILPNSVTEIGSSAFSKLDKLKSITIPDSVTTIRSYAFSYSYNLENIKIPDSVRYMDDNVFLMCTGLISVTIPDSVGNIGRYTFKECYKLAHIYYTGTEEQWNAIPKGKDWNYQMGSKVSGGTKIHYNYVSE